MSLTTPEDGMERRDMVLLARLPVRRGQVTDDGNGRTEDPTLTPRQRQVLDGLMRGLTNKEIAAELEVGPDAVKRTISRLLVKLNAPSRTALVQIALRTSAARLGRSRGPNALSLLDAAPIPALVTRGERHLVEYANPAAHSILGLADVGLALADAIAAEEPSGITAVADASFSGNRARIARSVALRRSDSGLSWRCADVFFTPVRDGADRLVGLIVFLVDVSAHARRGPAT